MYHDPATNDEWAAKQFSPAPQSAANSNVTVRVKVGYSSTYVNRLALYYTMDGATWPEGAGLLMLDYDAPQDGPALSPAELRATLANLKGISQRVEANPAGYLLGREQPQEFQP